MMLKHPNPVVLQSAVTLLNIGLFQVGDSIQVSLEDLHFSSFKFREKKKVLVYGAYCLLYPIFRSVLYESQISTCLYVNCSDFPWNVTCLG